MNGRIFVGKPVAAIRFFAVISFVLLMTAIPASAQKNKPVSIPLNADFRNDVTDAVASDSKGIYIDGYQNVRAEIYYGDFYFDTNENKGDLGRRVKLSLPSLSCPDCPSDADGYPHPQDVYIATHYIDDLAAMKLGDTQLKGFAINWAEGTKSYVLRFNNQLNNPNHGNVVFTCVAGDPCTQWTAEPNGAAGLYIKRPATRKQPAYEELLADVSMPFEMTLTGK